MSLSFCLFRGSFLVSPPPENFPSFFLMLLFLSNWSIGTSWRTGLFFIMSNLQYHLQNKACSGSSPTGRFLTVSFINYSDLGKRKKTGTLWPTHRMKPTLLQAMLSDTLMVFIIFYFIIYYIFTNIQ